MRTAGVQAGRTGILAPVASPHGWVDWAEWVEPVERSVAAMSASALGERVARLFSGTPWCPADSHVLVIVDVGTPPDRPVDAHRVRVATMVDLRAHFPFVDGVAALGASRFAVLARRHAGLAGTLASLEDRLREDVAGIGTVAAVWCEQLPDRLADLGAFLRGLRIKPRPDDQDERGMLATGLPVEVIAGTPQAGDIVDPPPGSSRRVPWVQRSAIAAAVTAVLMAAAGASAAAAVESAIHPWRAPAEEEASGVGEPPSSGPGAGPGSGADIVSMLTPGAAPTLIQELLDLLEQADASQALGGRAGAREASAAAGEPGPLLPVDPAGETPAPPDLSPPSDLPAEADPSIPSELLDGPDAFEPYTPAELAEDWPELSDLLSAEPLDPLAPVILPVLELPDLLALP